MVIFFLSEQHFHTQTTYFRAVRYINSRSHIFHTVQGKVAKIDRIRDAERDGERQWETEGDRKNT